MKTTTLAIVLLTAGAPAPLETIVDTSSPRPLAWAER